MPKTADNSKELTTECIKNAKNRYGCTGVCLVPDNAKNMEKIDPLKADHLNLVVSDCTAHWLNILGQEIRGDDTDSDHTAHDAHTEIFA